MLRLCSESSRSYTPQGGTEPSPGRSAGHAVERQRFAWQHAR